MTPERDYELKPHNSFGLAVKAAAFIAVEDEGTLEEALSIKTRPRMILGGGSNILFTKKYPGLLIHNKIKGKEIIRNYKHHVHISAGAGENWHELVCWAIENDLGGIENLSLIPGTVGAAPIQNIGAYGVELKDVLVRLEAMELKTGAIHIFKNKDCQFGYRDSIFKRQLKGRYCITKVILRLQKAPHRLHTAYGAIRKVLEENGNTDFGIRELSAAIIKIRQSKLPDPKKIGNAGSFFKNPIVAARKFKKLNNLYPKMPHYPQSDGKVKIPAAWLIDQCGWKGKRKGNVGCHINQPLVLVNYGGGTGKAIQKLSEAIQQSVVEKFGIKLSAEVNII